MAHSGQAEAACVLLLDKLPTGSGLLLRTLDIFPLSCLIIKDRNYKENNVRTWKSAIKNKPHFVQIV